MINFLIHNVFLTMKYKDKQLFYSIKRKNALLLYSGGRFKSPFKKKFGRISLIFLQFFLKIFYRIEKEE